MLYCLEGKIFKEELMTLENIRKEYLELVKTIKDEKEFFIKCRVAVHGRSYGNGRKSCR